MTNIQECLVCDSTDWPIVDFATGFVFCEKHYQEIKEEYNNLIGEGGLSRWLRSIANIIDREENDRRI